MNCNSMPGKCVHAGLLVLLLAWALPTRAEDAPVQASPADTESEEVEVVWEWDPYYTNVSANIPLTGTPIPTIRSDDETEIYSGLVRGSFIPRYMLLEASAYPMPLLGTHLRRRAPDFYDRGKITNSSFNLIESVTTGFQEPWALSAFFGNIANLVRPGEQRTVSNMGYTGYLISGGSKHIKRNVLIDDVWHELEWKIKGKREYADEKISWSFRVGGKFNRNPEVTDVVYLGLFRSNLDHRVSVWHWLKNTTYDLKVQFSQDSGKIVRQDFVVGKKFPGEKRNYTPTLEVGLVWESPDEYAGSLKDAGGSTLTLLLRPSVAF